MGIAFRLCSLLLLVSLTAFSEESAAPLNLLLNPDFEFHAFANHRHGRAENFFSHDVAFWNTDAWGDVRVVRESHAEAAVRPAFSTGNLVSIRPGKKLWQFFTLPEAGLSHGSPLSLFVHGHQPAGGALIARIQLLKLDSEDGTWSPSEFGHSDKRTFPRHSRGELVVAKTFDARSDQAGAIQLKIEGAEILGHFRDGNESHSDDVNTIGLRIEFENAGKADVWVYSPCLTLGDAARARLPSARSMRPIYRHLPRTIQKLWKGEALHVLLMGSSIDRGSANPPMALYDEDPASDKFKQPLLSGAFDGSKVGHAELDPYFGWWQHYFSYGGRLKLELMRKFDLPANKIFLHFMACDGSCVGEAHSGLADYCSLAIPPREDANGHKSGKSWQELYPELFERPEGPMPDLVIFGSGANEKTDTPDEVAVFEGMIRWIQRHYPNTEFLFCMWQNYGSYTPNVGDLQALALRYQIPVVDFGKALDDVARWCNRYALVPSDGHPQAAAHFLWFKQIERAFECWDPIETGQAQLQLPERVHPNSYGWEGEIITYGESSGRLKGNMFVFEDTAINCWGDAEEDQPVPFVDGRKDTSRRKFPQRDIRNSLFRHGRTRLGDRHVVELVGKGARLTWVDAKVCPNRQFLGIANPSWSLQGAKASRFASEWGAPYGDQQALLRPGKAMEIEAVFTDLSVAYTDAPDGGTLKVIVDGQLKLEQPANLPFTDQSGQNHFMENRKGVLGLPFGVHLVRLEAVDKPVPVLGVFTYDSRSNRALERRLVGRSASGETIIFSQPFKARPLVLCHEALRVRSEDVFHDRVTFTGRGSGSYEVVGE